MKNLSRISRFLALVLAIGSFYRLATNNSFVQFLAGSLTGRGSVDQYEIKWTGEVGVKLFGAYVISYPSQTKKPARAESVKAELPYDVKFSAPKGAIVTASDRSWKDGAVEIAILKNREDCGAAVLVGSGVGANKTCSPK